MLEKALIWKMSRGPNGYVDYADTLCPLVRPYFVLESGSKHFSGFCFACELKPAKARA